LLTIIVEIAPRLLIPKDGIVTTKGVKLLQLKLKYLLHIRLLAQRAASAPLTLEEITDDELLAVLNLGYSLLECRIKRLKAKEVRECIERNPEVWRWIRWALYVRDRILRGNRLISLVVNYLHRDSKCLHLILFVTIKKKK